MKILVINGPNINMLGIREPDVYGRKTYRDLVEYIGTEAEKLGVKVSFFQSNHEGAIVDSIQDAYQKYDGIVINPAAYTHTSIAIADALKAVALPAIEVHLTDPDEREAYRKTSYVRDACVSCVKGKGFEGYAEAVLILKELKEKKTLPL